MVNQDKCNKALIFASTKHEGQKMKNPNIGYVYHVYGVCLEAINGCLSSSCDVDLEKVIMLSLLHDTLEDTDATYNEIKNEFGNEIADGVMALTKNDELPKNEKMIDSIKRIKKQSSEVAIVKLADRIFNLRDIPPEWNEEKVNSYREEAILILNELGYNNEYLAKRLSEKINLYKYEMKEN